MFEKVLAVAVILVATFGLLAFIYSGVGGEKNDG